MSDDLQGPIDFVLIEFPDQDPSGEAAAELMALVDAGIIRLYDIIAVRKDADGKVSGFAVTDLGDSTGFAVFAGARSGMLGDDDVTEAGAAMENGTIAVLIVYENTWAAPFVAAARRAGGEMIATARIPAQDVLEVLDAIEAAD